MATALYRRYRPEAFAEMIGQAHVTEPLMTALRTGRIGHAYLFSGPRGCGKTTSARILARCLNCAEGPTDTPCGSCPSCVELSRGGGGSLDVVEIDAASHGGVDDARELRERAVFAPARDRYKIFIIDEAHMVTSGGFNALLKIVEEPPPHVKFIFATTEPEKVIGTIRSRTHHYPFRLIAPGALIDYVQQLCESEGVEVEAGVLPLVVRAGGGSVRDTLSILDQLIAGSEHGRVSLARATGLLGYTSAELIDETVVALGAGDSAAAFAATDRVVQTGQDPRRFVEDLLERLRDLIVISATTVQGASSVFRGVPDDQLQRMFEQSQAFALGQLSRIADTVAAALDTMAGATAPRLQLELMVARALRSEAGVGAGEARVAAGGAAGRGAAAGAGSASGSGFAPAAARASASASAPVTPASASASAGSAATGSASAGSAQAGRQAAPAANGARQPEPDAPAVESPSQADAPSDAAVPAAASSTSSSASASPAASSPDPAAVDLIATMRSAREFLKSDGAGASRPPMVPLGGHAPTPPAAPAQASDAAAQGEDDAPAAAPEPGAGPHEDAPEAPVEVDAPASTTSRAPAEDRASASASVSSPSSSAPSAADAAAVSFDELIESWQALLDELLEGDREAWNAVREVQPLALDGEVLTVGLASKSDLDAFKAVGAGPLREAIIGAFGISVKYMPKPLPAGTRPMVADREGAPPSPQEPSPASEAGPAADEGAEPADDRIDASDPAARPDRALRDPGLPPEPHPEPEPMPPPGEFGDPGFDPGRDPDYDPQYDERLGADERDPLQTGPEPEPAPQEDFEPDLEPEPGDESGRSAAAPGGSAEPSSLLPSVARYGEAVVREVLGARFIEERPLPEGFQR